jgi:hypothetical protein
MKRFLSFIAFVLLTATIVLAQGGNGNGGNSTNNNPNNYNAANYPLPHAVTVQILQQAHPYFNGLFGINLGQLVQAYRRGDCVIQFLGLGNLPSTIVFQVTFGGGISIVIIEDAG